MKIQDKKPGDKLVSEVKLTDNALSQLELVAESLGITPDVRDAQAVQKLLKRLDLVRSAARNTRGLMWKSPFGRRLLQESSPTRSVQTRIIDRPQYFRKAAAFSFDAMDKGNIPVGQSLSMIQVDPYMSPFQKAITEKAVLEANAGKRYGFVSTSDVVRGAIGAGLGYGAGSIIAGVLNGFFGLPPKVRKYVALTGGLAGALEGSGLAR